MHWPSPRGLIRIRLRISIQDSGPGIDKRAFGVHLRAVRADLQIGPRPRKDGPGSDSKLSISRRLARLMGGEIAVESRNPSKPLHA